MNERATADANPRRILDGTAGLWSARGAGV
jgi:hypothetical protein